MSSNVGPTFLNDDDQDKGRREQPSQSSARAKTVRLRLIWALIGTAIAVGAYVYRMANPDQGQVWTPIVILAGFGIIAFGSTRRAKGDNRRTERTLGGN